MTTIAYLRVSTEKQDADNQRLAILDFANTHRLTVDDFHTHVISSRASESKRGIAQMLAELNPGDTIIVAELSRLGRSISQIIRLIDDLIKNQIGLIAIKENINIPANGEKLDLQTKITTTLFALLGEIERDLISRRTKEGMARVGIKGSRSGRPIGRPRGRSHSALDVHREAIEGYLKLGLSQSAIAKLLKTPPTTLNSWLKSRVTQPGTKIVFSDIVDS